MGHLPGVLIDVFAGDGVEALPFRRLLLVGHVIGPVVVLAGDVHAEGFADLRHELVEVPLVYFAIVVKDAVDKVFEVLANVVHDLFEGLRVEAGLPGLAVVAVDEVVFSIDLANVLVLRVVIVEVLGDHEFADASHRHPVGQDVVDIGRQAFRRLFRDKGQVFLAEDVDVDGVDDVVDGAAVVDDGRGGGGGRR